MITRLRRYTKKTPSRDAHKIYILCEGSETEPDYFAFFEGLSTNLQIITIPPVNGKTDPTKLLECAQTIFFGSNRLYDVDYLQGDRVWFVIDTDDWEECGKIKPLRDFCGLHNKRITLGNHYEIKSYSAWNVAQSKPCFEIWLYYHIYSKKPNDKDVNAAASFKEFVNNAIIGGFNYNRDPARLADAIKNSKANFGITANGLIDNYSTEMFLLGEELMAFIKHDINKLRNKL